MSGKRLIWTSLVVTPTVLGSMAVAASTATAAGWMLHSKTLGEEGLTSAALKTTAKTDESGVLSGGGLTITCTGNLESSAPTLQAENRVTATSVIFTGCTATPTSCKVPTTIGTVPVEAEVTQEGVSAVKGVVKPQSGTGFTTLKITGEGCAAEGNKPVKGDIEVLAPTGQEERTDQELVVNQASSPLLLLGSSSASLKGKALLLLANGAAWSFLCPA